jgi:hypothetical protein
VGLIIAGLLVIMARRADEIARPERRVLADT